MSKKKNEIREKQSKEKNKIYNLQKDKSCLNEIQILLRSHPCLCTSITCDDEM